MMKPRQMNKTAKKRYNRLKRRNRSEALALRTQQDDAIGGVGGRK